MQSETNHKIEKFHLLKLASLSNYDRKWILKKLKTKNKSAFKMIMQKFSTVRRFHLSHLDFKDISKELNLQKLLEKSEIDKKIDAVNAIPQQKTDEIVKNLSYSDLTLFVFCDDALVFKKHAVNKLCVSKEFIENNIELNVTKNEKINAYLIDYLYENMVKVSK